MCSILESPGLELLPPPVLVSRLKTRAAELHMLPAVAIDAMEMAKDPECSIAAYAAVVERDVKLATDMLKITNSMVYSPSVPILSLHQAILRLGLKECQTLILTASFTSIMTRISLDQEWIREVLWQHSFNTALLATHLNNTFRFGFQGEEFTAGLIHDFGRTLLAVTVPEEFPAIDPLDFEESPEQLVREQQAVGTDHCRLGAWYAIQQQLPLPIREVILWHHQPEMAQDGRLLTSLIAVADHMANHLQRFKEATGYDPSSNPFVPILAKFGNAQFEKQFLKLSSSLMDKAQHDSEAMVLI